MKVFSIALGIVGGVLISVGVSVPLNVVRTGEGCSGNVAAAAFVLMILGSILIVVANDRWPRK